MEDKAKEESGKLASWPVCGSAPGMTMAEDGAFLRRRTISAGATYGEAGSWFFDKEVILGYRLRGTWAELDYPGHHDALGFAV